jgi:hypothetical protein
MKLAIATAAFICLFTTTVSATTCEDYSQYTRFVTRLETGGDIETVVIAGNYAYLANSSYPTADFIVVDITDPLAPVTISSLNSSGTTFDIDVEGSHAYAVRLNWDLQVIDVSDPATPSEVASVPIFNLRAVDALGNWAFVVGSDSALTSVDISDPTNPAITDNVKFTYRPTALHAVGDYVYVAIDRHGLAIVDATDPENLSIAGTLDIAGYTQSVYVDGTRAFLGANSTNRGLWVIDVSIPSSPSLLGSITGIGSSTTFHANDVIVDGTTAYLAGTQLWIFDVSGNNPTTLLTADVATSSTAIKNGFAFTAGGTSGLEVAELGTHATPFPLGGLYGDRLEDIEVEGNTAYAHYWNNDSDWGVKSFNVSNPGAPTLIGTLPMPTSWNVWAAAVNGGVAALCYSRQSPSTSAIAFIDLSGPVSIVHEFYQSYEAQYCDWVGDYLYVNSWGTLRIYDVSTLTSPAAVGSTTVAGDGGVEVAGGYLYVGFDVVDVTDPTAPAVVGSTTPTHFGAGRECVALSGSLAYVAYGDYLYVVDVANPAAPFIRSEVNMAGHVRWNVGRGVTTDGNFVYVALWTESVQVIDVSDPDNASLVGNTHGLEFCEGVEVANDVVYTASIDGLVEYAPQCVIASAVLFEKPTPAVQARVTAWPNPFNPATTIRFEVAERQRVGVSVYTATGRHVTTLADRVFAVGAHELTWDGRDADGVQAASGVYFARVVGTDFRTSIKLALVK